MTYQWHDLVGNLGVLTILGCYLLLQLERVNPRGWRFSLLNAVGAGLILISLLVEFNFSAFLVELAWFLISLFGVLRRVFLNPIQDL